MASRAVPQGHNGKPDPVAHVSRALLNTPLGDRIPTVQTLQSEIGVGSGTVVKALRTLQNSATITIEAHGHLGTVLVERDLGSLWELAHMGNLRVLLTPPGPVEQHALAAAIRQSMGEQQIPLVIDHVPGAKRRLQEVSVQGAHVTVTSRGAFAQHEAEYPNLRANELGERSYYDYDSLVVVARKGRAGTHPKRVGFDPSSDDHAQLSWAEFGDDVTHVPCSFVEGPAGVLKGDFDAVVWHRMLTIIPPELAGLVVRPLSISDDAGQIGQLSRAVLVTREADRAVGALLASVSPKRVRAHLRRLNRAVGTSRLPHEALWLG